VIATLVPRATARPVCEALLEALSRHGVAEQILTDNGKVFTGRLAHRPATVAFDRLCLHNGIRHLLTAPYSPTTTGKIERLHKTMRKELFDGCRFTSIVQVQADLDRWVTHYNLEREHQAIGDVAPIQRFELVDRVTVGVLDPDADTEEPPPPTAPATTRARSLERWPTPPAGPGGPLKMSHSSRSHSGTRVPRLHTVSYFQNPGGTPKCRTPGDAGCSGASTPGFPGQGEGSAGHTGSYGRSGTNALHSSRVS
jgi:hypothetical protein